MRMAWALALMMVGMQAKTPENVLGFWREPQGSVIEVFRCGRDVCARLAAIPKDAPSLLDVHNPDEAKRKDALCGLQIGYGFHLADAAHAEDGKLYDPKSGKTYRGAMTAEGDALHLRGYVGIKAFGRSETWTRTVASTASCMAHR